MPIPIEEANRRQYEKDEGEHNCGYWSVCDDHACGCANSNNVDGFDNGVYQSMKEELQKEAEEFDDEYEPYEPLDLDEYEDEDCEFEEQHDSDILFLAEVHSPKEPFEFEYTVLVSDWFDIKAI